MIQDPECENYIDINKMDPTAFTHAVATLAPMLVYEAITGKKVKDSLEFNHLANRLCMQFCKIEK